MTHWVITRDDGVKLIVTPLLRYVIRDGEKVLQQFCLEHTQSYILGEERKSCWVDVSIEDDSK